ncbi:hypothetical protein AKJ44_02790 [candidate division MSBL1 archaeon SCGC-AAA261F17]|uniref:Uncharacterized protein n=1 Tax=candidate division MSBL1 archaeon SCGC-AAA261F17 TaxID=1698274 RepID=A0A133V446_9EURY|nr:hypothetical protein AKJ44_02790 [candidate division MSBL1 archaeon SCGC-AAA261F17]
MIDPEKFEQRWNSFSSNYMRDFNSFWNWKLEIEKSNGHILDDSNLGSTHRRLCGILPGWQTYRPYGLNEQILREALEEISWAYDKIRNHSLLEFKDIPRETLRLIWTELGRVKTKNRSDYQYVMSVCKPLMMLWGQTLAFDKNVRKKIPFAAKTKSKWNFETWKSIMNGFSHKLNQSPETVEFLKEWSRKEFGTDTPAPYGRFLDIYYFTDSSKRFQQTRFL